MRTLVTGAAGFAGGHMIHYLLQETAQEIIGTIYRRQPSYTWPAKRVHLEQLDLREESAVAEILTRWHPDFIIHLAGQSFVPVSWKHPWPTFEQNVLTLINILKGVRLAHLQSRILVISSGEVYGDIRPADLPIDEQTSLRPTSPYAVSKVAEDLLGWQYYRSHGLQVLRVRPFNHIGPGQNELFVTSSFARQVALIEAGKAPPVLRHGNLSAQRDFTDVRDMVHAYWLVLQHGEAGDVYNIGSGRGTSIHSILSHYLARARVPITLEEDPDRMRPADIPTIICDPTRVQQRTGWVPSIPLEQTLDDILADWRQRV